MLTHLLLCCALLPAGPSAQAPVENPTEILVIATPHLAEKGGVDMEATLPVRSALEAWKPDAIAVEAIAPEVLADMEARGGFYQQVAEMFASSHVKAGHEAQASLHLSRTEARNEMEKQLGAALSPGPAARRRLAATMLAAYHFESAQLQWSYLPAEERRSGDGLTSELARFLESGLQRPNEDVSLALPVARDLQLQQLYQIDDQTDAILFQQLDQAHPGELEKIEQRPETAAARNAAIYTKSSQLLDAGKHDGAALLREYQWVNSAEYGAKDVELQWGRYRHMHLASGVDRGRLAQWETRNLRIASHVRAVSALYPGGRVLVLIGAAHKPFLDTYLCPMMDVKVVQLDDILPGK